MRRSSIVTIATAVALTATAAAGPLSAQESAIQYDTSAPVTLEGTADIVIWDMAQSELRLQPATGAQEWDIVLPKSKVLLDKGISAEVLARGAPVKVKALKAKDGACEPRCKAQAVELTVAGKTVALGAATAAPS